LRELLMRIARSLHRGPRMAGELVRVPDEEVERLAKEQGPGSIAARVLANLRSERAKDRQVFAFRIGPYWISGPVPDARTEALMIEFA
jgi:hypothetical protein